MGFDYSERNRRWQRLRARVLRESEYRCEYAKRFGRREAASHVHHIWPVEDYPEYAYERWNLIALSQASHNAMHDRASGRLTAAGDALRRRTIPPGSGRGKDSLS